MFEIRTLGENDKISTPGFYAISLDRHHNQPCDGVSVTSGVLRTLELQSPADYWAFSTLNPDRYTKEPTRALITGQAMAAFVEAGEEGLQRSFLKLPENKPNKPTQAQIDKYDEGNPTPAGKKSVEFWRRVEEDHREVLTAEEWKLITDMGAVVRSDPGAAAALGGHPEVTMAWRDEVNDLWCLARPDQTSFSGLISDYKKVNTQGRAFNGFVCDSRITQHGYDQQMAFADEGFQALTREKPSQVGLVFQWDQPPYHVILRGIEEEDIEIGTFRNRRARRTFRHCLDTGDWWGPGVDIGSYRRPDKLRERLIEEMNTETGMAAE